MLPLFESLPPPPREILSNTSPETALIAALALALFFAILAFYAYEKLGGD